jgi:hypothetical protein
VVAFIFADLIVLPILNIYRKYYGLKMAGFLFATFYVSMAVSALVIDLIFGAFALIPSEHKARVRGLHHLELHDLGELGLSGSRRAPDLPFPQNRRPSMLRMMNKPGNHRAAHQHDG